MDGGSGFYEMLPRDVRNRLTGFVPVLWAAASWDQEPNKSILLALALIQSYRDVTPITIVRQKVRVLSSDDRGSWNRYLGTYHPCAIASSGTILIRWQYLLYLGPSIGDVH